MTNTDPNPNNNNPTHKQIAFCETLYKLDYFFPQTPDEGYVFYPILFGCAILVILYCLWKIHRQRAMLRKGVSFVCFLFAFDF